MRRAVVVWISSNIENVLYCSGVRDHYPKHCVCGWAPRGDSFLVLVAGRGEASVWSLPQSWASAIIIYWSFSTYSFRLCLTHL